MSGRQLDIPPHVEYVRVEGDFVLMDLKRGTYFGLDPVGSHIWQSLADHGDAGRAADDLCRDYEVEPERAVADVERWVADLTARGLICARRP